ncbi:ATP-binding cassette domain-containing protein [Paeniroseomonas aquatica]|uniref:ATP-binding cassette domain-containing protein n=1 Tax=Paeniroseomonas aquatica TaxID=373043 RepID=A0ABT8A2P5_9PROT|nr:ATP-binding cassette domain-containing protein [Paeniroseomonas aquatica]MDN3563943.1 ATP-binding cassette domain-containing protein [Paeniroseomonas aquatica]
MIDIRGLTKRWPGADRNSVSDVTLAVPEGTSCALIGPSGSGKTTLLRMVNRLVEPSAGSIRIGGEDALRMDAVSLRRRIGYVIQDVGLFPHWSVAANVATVPRLLGWDAARIARRVEEVLALVGLDPARFAERRPHQLSGGERQRVGVARALAGDPPVLLMDEPFGAVDPVVRGRLQEEVLRLLKQLRKTVLIVTHDVAEAVRLGDAVALLRDGRLVQHAPAAEMLAQPADGFAAEFLGADRLLLRLSLFPLSALPARTEPAPGTPLPVDATLRDALAALLAAGATTLPLAGGGSLALDDLLAFAAAR